jgi:hypothetical protein
MGAPTTDLAIVPLRHSPLAALFALSLLTDAQQAPPVPFHRRLHGRPPFSNARAELFVPEAGPFPATVILHGCNGVVARERVWAQQVTAHRRAGRTSPADNGLSRRATRRRRADDAALLAAGRYIGRNLEAAAVVETRRFLAERLSP